MGVLADATEGVLKQSDTEAYLWGRKAANKGLAKAEYAVGCEWTRSRGGVALTADYTEMGIGVKQDMESAKRWYMRAAGELARTAMRPGANTAAQQHKRAMQRLTELNNSKNVKGKRGARPTRHEASSECVVM